MMTLYLAHPFDARKWIREWELGFEKRTNIDLVNPFYDVERRDIEEIDLGRHERYEKINSKELVLRDVNKIYNSDGMISFVTGDLSYGTLMEMVYNHLIDHPNYMYVSNGHQDHPWLKYHSTKIFTDLGELEKHLDEIYNKR